MSIHTKARSWYQVPSSISLHLRFETGSLIEPRLYQFGQMGWPASLRGSPVSPSQLWVTGPTVPGFCLWVLESGAQDFTLMKQACHLPLPILHSSFVYGANIQTPSFQFSDALRPLLLSAVTFLVGSKGRKGVRTLTYFLCSFQNFSLVASKDERNLLSSEQLIPSQTWRPWEVILFCWSEAQGERRSLCRTANRSWDTKPRKRTALYLECLPSTTLKQGVSEVPQPSQLP